MSTIWELNVMGFVLSGFVPDVDSVGFTGMPVKRVHSIIIPW